MKKNFKALLIATFSLGFAFVSACSNGNSSSSSSSPVDSSSSEPSSSSSNSEASVSSSESAPSSSSSQAAADIDVSGIKFLNGNFTYDGQPHSISVTKKTIPEGVTVEYENNDKTLIDVYVVTANFYDANHNLLGSKTAKLSIVAKKIDISKVTFESKTFDWEKGKSYTVEASNIPSTVTVEYENNTTTDVGSKTAKCKIYDNYNKYADPNANLLLGELTCDLKVKYRAVTDQTKFASASYVADGTTSYSITLPADVASTFKSVEYSGNTGTTQGYYYASALVETLDGDKYEYRAVLTIDNPDDTAFNTYADEMFIEFLEGDQATLNIFMEDYKAFGMEHQDTTWSKYEKYSDEDYQHDLLIVDEMVKDFEAIDYSKLSFSQQITYARIENNIASYTNILANKNNILMRQNYIDQYGGDVADFPTTLEAYQLRTVEDVEDMINYVDTMKECMLTYVDYAKDRAEAGYALSAFTIGKMVEYLDGVSGRKTPADEKTEYYLIQILKNKIIAAQTSLHLSDEQVASYVAQLDAAFVKFIDGHVELANKLESECLTLAGGKESYYLSSYGEEGKTLYAYLLRSRLGLHEDTSLEDYIAYLDKTIEKYYIGYSSYSASSGSTAAAIMNGEVPIISKDTTAEEYLEYLKEFAKTIVPDLASTPEIDFTYMDKTVTANTTTLAYYMKSALDSTDAEHIHLNGDALGKDYLETIKTIAHEGYPGHLYAYVSTKENANISNLATISTCTGHGEGWAKYVEIALGEYIAAQKGGGDWTTAMRKSAYWDLFVYNIYSRVDIGINYQGWREADVVKYFKNNNLSLDEEKAKDLIRTLSEVPTQYAPYGYGQSFVYELHEEAKAILGDNYNEVEFNAMLLEHGWCGLDDLKDYYYEYMTQKCHLLGLEFVSEL